MPSNAMQAGIALFARDGRLTPTEPSQESPSQRAAKCLPKVLYTPTLQRHSAERMRGGRHATSPREYKPHNKILVSETAVFNTTCLPTNMRDNATTTHRR